MEVDAHPPVEYPIQEQTVVRPLFGGAITCCVPARFLDVSDIREVPDSQEVLCDYDREESIIIELLQVKSDVTDEDSVKWFLHNVAEEQEAENTVIVEDGKVLTESDVPNMPASVIMKHNSGMHDYHQGASGTQPSRCGCRASSFNTTSGKGAPRKYSFAQRGNGSACESKGGPKTPGSILGRSGTNDS